MKAYIATSKQKDAKLAVSELKKSFAEQNKTENFANIKAITFFASTIYDAEALIQAMNANFPDINVCGCSSVGEIISGSVQTDSIVAMAMTDEIIEDIKIVALANINQNLDMVFAAKQFQSHYGTIMGEMDSSKYFGLVYMDPISMKEEEIMDALGNFTNVIFGGGSAADNMKFEKTYIYANGQIYPNGVVFALIKSKVAFSFIKTQSFMKTEKTAVVTKFDEKNRILYELDNRPAAEVLAEVINCKVENIPDYFGLYTFGIMIDGEPYIRDINKMRDNKYFDLACSIKTGTVVNILQSNNIIEHTKQDLDNFKKTHPNISGIVLINCINRYNQLKKYNQVDEYGNLFKDVPTIGLNSFGEAYLGHLNFTAVLLILE